MSEGDRVQDYFVRDVLFPRRCLREKEIRASGMEQSLSLQLRRSHNIRYGALQLPRGQQQGIVEKLYNIWHLLIIWKRTIG